ncbi:MAG: FecR domain-containing protein [Deltaproteobacteria bacterium]|nr:FecR domain-containing protein [Deltaproteobacteria bacterium]
MRAAILGGTAAAALALCALAGAAPTPPPGQVTFVSGEASRIAGGKPEKLQVGSAIFENDTVETQGRTRLEITLRDQSVVRVGPRSRVQLSAAVFGRSLDDRKVAARLVVGDMWAKVAKAVGGESKFEVQTANAVAGVRGTTFRVDARADRSVVVKVYGGSVAVAGKGPIPRPTHGGDDKDDAPPPQAPAQGAAPAPAPAQGQLAAPGGKKERRQVAGPGEVSREAWEKLVGEMMQVRVAADGTPAEPEPFALAGAKADEFEAWNRERDAMK